MSWRSEAYNMAQGTVELSATKNPFGEDVGEIYEMTANLARLQQEGHVPVIAVTKRLH